MSLDDAQRTNAYQETDPARLYPTSASRMQAVNGHHYTNGDAPAASSEPSYERVQIINDEKQFTFVSYAV